MVNRRYVTELEKKYIEFYNKSTLDVREQTHTPAIYGDTEQQLSAPDNTAIYRNLCSKSFSQSYFQYTARAG